MKELRFQPISGKTDEIIDSILKCEEVASCTNIIYPIHLVCEELVVNVVSYAYPNDADGYLHVLIDKSDNYLTITFKDGGVPFNPLAKDTPDISLPLEEREIGGLGIFLTQQMMDVVTYDFVNNENVLTVKKCIDQ